jgi:hypothetical protein
MRALILYSQSFSHRSLEDEGSAKAHQPHQFNVNYAPIKGRSVQSPSVVGMHATYVAAGVARAGCGVVTDSPHACGDTVTDELQTRRVRGGRGGKRDTDRATHCRQQQEAAKRHGGVDRVSTVVHCLSNLHHLNQRRTACRTRDTSKTSQVTSS